MFKKNFKPQRPGAGCSDPIVRVQVQTSLDDNSSEFDIQQVELSSKLRNAPPLESFDLKRMLDSGVNIKEVNSVIFQPTDLTSQEIDQVEKVISKSKKQSKQTNVEPSNE